MTNIITNGDQWLNPEEIDRLEVAYKAGMREVVETYKRENPSLYKKYEAYWQMKSKEWEVS